MGMARRWGGAQWPGWLLDQHQEHRVLLGGMRRSKGGTSTKTAALLPRLLVRLGGKCSCHVLSGYLSVPAAL